MDIIVRKMSLYVDSILKNNSTGTVHSVYRKTINISFNGKIIALQADGSPLSPVSLITELSASDMEFLTIQKNDIVDTSKGVLKVHSSSGCFSFFYTDALRCDLKLSCICTPEEQISVSVYRDRLVQNIKRALFYADTGGFQPIFNCCPQESLSLMLLTAKNRIIKSLEMYRNGKTEEAADQLVLLLGLGPGLTPSGDDFLCGILAGLHLIGREEDHFARLLKSKIKNRLSDTIDISAAFLSCALDGQYSLAVNHLMAIPDPREIFDSFSAIGHSSGMDTLCGVLYVLTSVN